MATRSVPPIALQCASCKHGASSCAAPERGTCGAAGTLPSPCCGSRRFPRRPSFPPSDLDQTCQPSLNWSSGTWSVVGSTPNLTCAHGCPSWGSLGCQYQGRCHQRCCAGCGNIVWCVTVTIAPGDCLPPGRLASPHSGRASSKPKASTSQRPPMPPPPQCGGRHRHVVLESPR